MTRPKDPHTVHQFSWHGIEIELTYCPVRWTQISHIELRAINPERAPLPLTETGICRISLKSARLKPMAEMSSPKSLPGWMRRRTHPNGKLTLQATRKETSSDRQMPLYALSSLAQPVS